MSEQTNQPVEHQELDLSNPNDLEIFLESAEDVYADALDRKEVARWDGYEKLQTDTFTGEQVFEELYKKLTELQEKVAFVKYQTIPGGLSVSDVQVEEFQDLYNDLIALRNLVRDAYDAVSETRGGQTETFIEEEVSAAVADEQSQNAASVSGFDQVPESTVSHEEQFEDAQPETEPMGVKEVYAEGWLSAREEHESVAEKESIPAEETSDTTEPVEDKEEEIDTFDEEVEEVDEGESEEEIENLTPEVRRKSMLISDTDETEGSISIQIAKKARERVVEETEASKRMPDPIEERLVVKESEIDQADTVSVAAQLEAKDPLNQAVTQKKESINHAALVHEETSLQRQYLNTEKYTSFITAHYTSPAAYERMLDTVVTQIEMETVDALERFFGESYESPFAYLQDMTIKEVIALGEEQGLREKLREKNIKYETFLTWIDLLDEMQVVVGTDPDMVFGELFARWMIESEMAQAD